MTSPSPVRVALIGYGFVGKFFHTPLITAEPRLILKIVSSRDAQKVHHDLPDVKVVQDPIEAITSSETDLIVIASPNDTHAPLACAALQAGKHVIVDKPFTINVGEARQLLKLAKEQKRLLSVFHNRRWDSDFLTVRRLIKEQTIGSVVHFESHIDRYRPIVRDRWREANGPGSGVWYDLGPHLIDQAMQIFGLPIGVYASLASMRKQALTDDWAHIILHYENLKVILHASMLVAGASPRFIVHGIKGSIVKMKADQQEQQLLSGMRPGTAGWGEDCDPARVYDGSGTVSEILSTRGDQREFYKGIASALTEGAINPVCPIEALAVMAVLEAAMISATNGETVVPDLSLSERKVWKETYLRKLTESA